MEQFTLTEDIHVHCITANSFPEGVQQAHESLHALTPFDSNRKYFGLSWPDRNGTIIYKSAAEELHKDELSKHQLETKTIQKGEYLYINIHDFSQNIPAIGNAFQQLIHDEGIDPDGCCIEWYLSPDVCRCMVKSK